jgi:prepilin signal peptidase PulO-like enzyme (type II secretory pathway)
MTSLLDELSKGPAIAIYDSGPGSAGSPDTYRWVRHTFDPGSESRIVTASSALAAALLTIAAGYSMSATAVQSLGLLFGALAMIALSRSLSVLAFNKPRIRRCPKTNLLPLRYQPVTAAPFLLMCLIFSPTCIVIGYGNDMPQAVLGGVVGFILTISMPAIVTLQRRNSYLQLGPDSIRVATLFDDIEGKWEDIHGIHATEAMPGLDAISLQHANGALQVRKRIRGLSSNRPRTHPWQVLVITWGVSTNSLASTMIFLRDNAEARESVDDKHLTAMLTVPGWAIRPRGRFFR